MELRVLQDYEAMSAAAAELITHTIEINPSALLCFATGGTPRRTYELFVEYVRERQIDVSGCHLIGLDEWIAVPSGNTGSCHYFLHHYLLNPLNIDPSQFHLFDGMTMSPEQECQKMDAVIAAQGGIDLAVVGVGMNGHIGFNEPGTATTVQAHLVELDESTTTVGQKYFREALPLKKGITVGLGQLMSAKQVLLVANGSKKAPVIERAVEGEVSKHFPASLIRQHINGVVMVDKEAASSLKSANQ
jgi:glucosamine-6-phosphate isomerase